LWNRINFGASQQAVGPAAVYYYEDWLYVVSQQGNTPFLKAFIRYKLDRDNAQGYIKEELSVFEYPPVSVMGQGQLVFSDGKGYFFEGNKIRIYDMKTDTWTETPNNTPYNFGNSPSRVLVENKIYFFGVWIAASYSYNSVVIYDIETGTMTAHTVFPTQMFLNRAIVQYVPEQRKFYLFGVSQSNTDSMSVYTLDIDTFEIEQTGDMIYAPYTGRGVATLHGDAICLVVYNSGKIYLEVYSTETKSTTGISGLLPGSYVMAYVYIDDANDKMVVAATDSISYTDLDIKLTPYKDKDICCIQNGTFIDGKDRIIYPGRLTTMEGDGYIRFVPYLFNNSTATGGELIIGWRMSGHYLS